MPFSPPAIEIWAWNGWQFPLGVGIGNTDLWGKIFGLAISQLASRVRGRGESEAYALLRLNFLAQGER